MLLFDEELAAAGFTIGFGCSSTTGAGRGCFGTSAMRGFTGCGAEAVASPKPAETILVLKPLALATLSKEANLCPCI